MSLKPALELELDELTTVGELESFAGEWSALCQRVGSATPFQSPGWLIPFCRIFAGGQTRTFSVRCRARLVAVVPFYLYNSPPHNGAGSRRLLLLGSGLSDYLDLTAEPAFARAAVRSVLERLEQSSRDLCECQHLRPNSAWLTTDPPPAWRQQTDLQEVCPVLNLPARESRLERLVPAGIYRNVRYCRRRAGKSGNLEVVTATAENFERLFGELLALHSARWQLRSESGMFAASELEAFHREAARRLLREGLLRLFALQLGGRTIAVYYGMFQHRQAFYYLSGFHPDYAQLSPGSLLIAEAIEQAAAAGASAFHFLRGREAYKYHWGATDRSTFRRRWWSIKTAGRR